MLQTRCYKCDGASGPACLPHEPQRGPCVPGRLPACLRAYPLRLCSAGAKDLSTTAERPQGADLRSVLTCSPRTSNPLQCIVAGSEGGTGVDVAAAAAAGAAVPNWKWDILRPAAK
jgi:hypothetical protein